MVVGVLQLQLFIPQSGSLKSKRQLIKGLKDKIRHKFNVSVAETDNLDKWQRETLAVACVNRDKRLVNAILSKVVNLVDGKGQLELIDYSIEIY